MGHQVVEHQERRRGLQIGAQEWREQRGGRGLAVLDLLVETRPRLGMVAVQVLEERRRDVREACGPAVCPDEKPFEGGAAVADPPQIERVDRRQLECPGVDHRRHQLVLRREVLVERHGAHAELRGQLPHHDRADSRALRLAREDAQDALAHPRGIPDGFARGTCHGFSAGCDAHRLERRDRGPSNKARDRRQRGHRRPTLQRLQVLDDRRAARRR